MIREIPRGLESRRMAEDRAGELPDFDTSRLGLGRPNPNPTPSVTEESKALAEFTDYFARNYPGPDTIIHNPHWHAPRIFKAAQHAMKSSAPQQTGLTEVEFTPFTFNDSHDTVTRLTRLAEFAEQHRDAPRVAIHNMARLASDLRAAIAAMQQPVCADEVERAIRETVEGLKCAPHRFKKFEPEQCAEIRAEENGYDIAADAIIKKLRAALLVSDRSGVEDETGWLIEENAGGFIHWVALAKDAWPRTEVKDRRLGSRSTRSFERYLSPVEYVKDANAALRFARKEDAEAVIKLFDRFLLCPVATEHCWPSTALDTPTVDEGEE